MKNVCSCTCQYIFNGLHKTVGASAKIKLLAPFLFFCRNYKKLLLSRIVKIIIWWNISEGCKDGAVIIFLRVHSFFFWERAQLCPQKDSKYFQVYVRIWSFDIFFRFVPSNLLNCKLRKLVEAWRKLKSTKRSFVVVFFRVKSSSEIVQNRTKNVLE